MTTREWSLTYPARIVPTNAFFQKFRYDRGRITDEWRGAFCNLAKVAHVPPLATIGVTVDVCLKYRRIMDCEAPFACGKAAVDGIVDAGVLPDDKPPHVRWVHYNAPVIGCESDSLTLTIVDLQEAEDNAE